MYEKILDNKLCGKIAVRKNQYQFLKMFLNSFIYIFNKQKLAKKCTKEDFSIGENLNKFSWNCRPQPCWDLYS